jgi:hypothetical protein
MVVTGRIKIPEHSDGFDLGPTTPSSNHVNRPTFILDAMLASTAAEGMGAVECPGLVTEILQVCREGTAEYAAGLWQRTANNNLKSILKNCEGLTYQWSILHDSTIFVDFEEQRPSQCDILAIKNCKPNKGPHWADLWIVIICVEGPRMGITGLSRFPGLQVHIKALNCTT